MLSYDRLARFLIFGYIFIFPLRGIFELSGVSASRVVPLIVILFWSIHILFMTKVRQPSYFHLLLLLYALWATITVLWSGNLGGLLVSFTYIGTGVFVYAFWDLMRKWSAIILCLKIYILGAVTTAFIEIIYFLTENVDRAGEFTGGPNEFAIRILFALPMSWYFYVSHQGRMRYYWLTSITVILISIVLSQSRQAFLGLFLVFITIFIHLLLTGKLKSSFFVPLLLTVPFSQSLFQRIINTYIGFKKGNFGDSVEVRISIFEAGLAIFSQQPIRGVGIGQFRRYITPIVGKPRPTENAFLAVGVETGFIGLLLFSIMIFCLFRGILNISKKSILSVQLILVWFVGAMLNNWESGIITYFIFILVICINTMSVRTADN